MRRPLSLVRTAYTLPFAVVVACATGATDSTGVDDVASGIDAGRSDAASDVSLLPPRDSALPDSAALPDATLPDATLPDATLPDATLPDATLPDASVCVPGQAVCGRGVAGVRCAMLQGASFGAASVWQPDFSDAAGWNVSASTYATMQFPDLNGDGQADVCGRATAGIACALSNGASFGGLGVLAPPHFTDAGGWAASPAYYATIQFPDVNGDGKSDLCGRGIAGITCALSTGTSFGAESVWRADFTDAGGWKASAAYYATIQYADVNGDGKADVCGRGAAGLACAVSNGTSFAAFGSWQTALFSDAGSWATSPGYYSTIQFPDLNGDGKADVCGRGVAGVECALSNGTTFGASSSWSAYFSDAAGWKASPSYYATIQFPDVNGDGKADVCGRGVAGVECALSNGTTFGPVTLWQAAFSDAAGVGANAVYYSTMQFPDVNGDGKADVCGRTAAGVECALSSGASFGALGAALSDFSDASGWATSPAYATTIQFPITTTSNCARGLRTPARAPASRFAL